LHSQLKIVRACLAAYKGWRKRAEVLGRRSSSRIEAESAMERKVCSRESCAEKGSDQKIEVETEDLYPAFNPGKPKQDQVR
jgi:hypothetical protein